MFDIDEEDCQHCDCYWDDDFDCCYCGESRWDDSDEDPNVWDDDIEWDDDPDIEC